MDRNDRNTPPLSGNALRDAIRQAIGKYIDLQKYDVFIFGSEAAGTGSPRSDIDIGIRGPKVLEPHVVQRIRDELEKLRTLRVFDVVDFKAADPAFGQTALQRAEKL